MYFTLKCEELLPCPWCGDVPELCSDGFGNWWVVCQNSSLPTESGRTCPVCPSARSSNETLRLPSTNWSRDEAILKWNSFNNIGVKNG